ncbi:MAG TPA: mycothiol synthase [Streptosporangiaceae bacterium]|nr:mycothiol synthase [Streptosporangiaceae bacterium]
MSEPMVVARDRLSADEIAQVLALVEAAAAADGVHPLAEQTMLALRAGGPALLAFPSGAAGPGAAGSDAAGPGAAGDALAGYAYRDDGAAEFVVHPEHRRRGVGRALARALREPGGGWPRVWAHGDLPAAGALAASLGWSRLRTLWQLRRPLADPIPDAPPPAGVRIRTFEPGRDEAAWLELNRRAFATHPEQGRWTIDDLMAREREPWFDPAGFFLAEEDVPAPAEDAATDEAAAPGRASRLIGFHWTKVHGDGLGEVYVVGVDPAARGRGLGRVLTVAGLGHLRAIGLLSAMLYVDDENLAAVRMYESLGFVRWSADVMYGE